MNPTTQNEVDDILDTLEKRIRSSNRDAFLPNRTPLENGEVARLARESAKDVAKQAINRLIAEERIDEVDGFDDVLVGNAQNQALNVRRRIGKRRAELLATLEQSLKEVEG